MTGMLVCLDAGHGLYTAGRRCMKALDPAETREWRLNSRIAGYAEAALLAYGCRAMRADDATGASDVPLSTRAARAKASKAGMLVSIHANAGIGGGPGGGISVFVSPSATKESRRLAQAVYDETVARTGLRGDRSQGVWEAQFAMASPSLGMPAALGEFGFMDSSSDVPAILTDAFARKCAEGIAAAVAKCAGLEPVGGADKSEGVDPPGSAEPSRWASEACEWAAGAGLFVGDGGGYDWQGPLTREALAVLLQRYHAMRAAK